jgi:hypothetical protein
MKIFQGPGNQMFQVAFGLAAAKRLNVELKLDLSWYDENSYHRQYILDKLNIKASVANQKEIFDIVTCNASGFISYKWNRLNRLYLRPYYQRPKLIEPIDKFDLNFTKIMDRTYVEGYFASRDFFADHFDYVKECLQFKTEPGEINKRMIDQIRTENAVAISFRLGDFLGHPWQNVCSFEYYARCVKYLTDRFQNLRFYVFSDDIDWVKKNFKIDHPMVFMDFNSADYMEDFRLLTHFRLHIIPNSTFSWWGALLAGDKNKTVLCPEYWLSPDKSTYKADFGNRVVDFSRVLPEEWVRIPNMEKGDHYIGQ